MTDPETHEQKKALLSRLLNVSGNLSEEDTAVIEAIWDDVEQLKLERETPSPAAEVNVSFKADIPFNNWADLRTGQTTHNLATQDPAVFAAFLRAVADTCDPPKPAKPATRTEPLPVRVPVWAQQTRMDLPTIKPEPVYNPRCRYCNVFSNVFTPQLEGEVCTCETLCTSFRCNAITGMMCAGEPIENPTDNTGTSIIPIP